MAAPLVSEPTADTGAGAGRLQPGWIVPALLAGFPVWWALGLGELIFPLAGAAMAADLVARRSVLVPRHFGLYAGFVVAVAASGMMLDAPSNLIGWFVRLAQYASVGLIVPYALTHRRDLRARRVVRALVVMWLSSVALGTAALVLGPVSFPTVTGVVLPAGITENSFVHEQVNPSLADVDGFLGFASVRPKAPFTYTNGWGAALGLLFPFAVFAAVHPVGLSRTLVRASLVVGVIPMTLSLNRGLWVSVAFAVVFGAVAATRVRGARILARLLVVAVVAVAAIAVSPLGTLLVDRVETPHSNDTRGSLYVQVIDELSDSPFLGYGAPRAQESGPPLGTHGQLWIVLFTTGLVGATLYFGFMFVSFLDSGRPRTDLELAVHVVLAVSLVQVFFYGHVPQQLAIIMATIALSALSRWDQPLTSPDPATEGVM